MTDAKFTPGPWRVGFPDGVTADVAVRNPGYTPIVVSTPPFAFGAAVALVDGDENANLVAAAPDLYAALAMIERICDSGEDDKHNVDAIRHHARIALAKARGEALK